MRLLSEAVTAARYGPATAAHVQSSAAALQELAALVSVGSELTGVRPLHVRVSHFDHGAFLSNQLFSVSVLPVSGRTVQLPPDPVRGPSPPATLLGGGGSATVVEPLVLAVVPNHTVEVQIEVVLTALWTLLGRQGLVHELRGGDVSGLDTRAKEADARAELAVQDAVRTRGWRAAAAALRDRSRAAGRPLRVHYDPVLFDADALRARAPVLRRVYNEMPQVRDEIDKVATLLSTTLTVVGAGSQKVSAFARQLLDVGEHRTFLAHAARDAFVCGNGYLSIGAALDEDMQLLRPELTTLVAEDVAVVTHGDREVRHEPVMHLRGAEQIGSAYGVSILEPFVQLLNGQEVFQQTITSHEAWIRAGTPDSWLKAGEGSLGFANRMLPVVAERAAALLGGTTGIMTVPPSDLYFPGHVRMEPAAEGLTMHDPDADPNPGP